MNRKTGGFTIIEVLIVLSIAALIMLIVFVAIPGTKAAERDTRRRSDLGKFYAGVEEYQIALNTTRTPFVSPALHQTQFENFIDKYLGPEFENYNIVLKDGGADHHQFPHETDLLVFFAYHYCSDNQAVERVSSPGYHPPYSWSVLIGMEKTKEYSCLDKGNRGS